MNQVTSILASIDRGEPQAAEKLLPLVYDELRKLARAKMANQPSGHTLQATALVHEAWIRLVGPDGRIGQEWDSRGHFFAAAAESMRRILIEHARRKASLKRGGQMKRIDLEDAKLATNTEPDVLLAIHEALEKLKKEDETNYQLISLRFFAGLRMVEIAKILGVSPATAKRKWSYARAWLFREILAAEKELE